MSPFFTICAGFHRAFPNLESAFQYHGMGFTTSGVGISVYIYMLRGLRLAIRGLKNQRLAGLGGWGLGSERIKD